MADEQDVHDELRDRFQKAASTKRRRTVRALVEAALALLEDQSWRDLRMDEVARQAGVSEATAYYHFKTKQELLMAAFDAKSAPLIADHYEVVAKMRDGEPVEAAITQYVQALVRMACADRDLTEGYLAAWVSGIELTKDARWWYGQTWHHLSVLLPMEFEGRGRPLAEFTGRYHTAGILLSVVANPDLTEEELAERALAQVMLSVRAAEARHAPAEEAPGRA